ncbi:hypothetical protein [Spiroplasma sp. AdecLV25b]|uniref:hypothetical protein n=1 Tax=Spiroplasma sp. AdecLV25b TaxID=3027162 RepID=UPI0027DF8FA3|nr:hypothetical protein [Spiroplasma sp. AdecLV25b]
MKENNIFKIMIINDEDIKDANFYFKIKGKDLYMHVIKIFQDKFHEKNFNYKEISSYIMHDKSLRDNLFRYFAYLEEHLRSKLLNIKDVDKIDSLKNLNFIERKVTNNISNLYLSIIKNENKVTFTKLIGLLEKADILTEKEITELNLLIKLRNEIMHHNLLLIKDFITWDKVEKNINELKNTLKILLTYLPDKYKNGFINSINKLSEKDSKKNPEYFTRINLGALDYHE